MQHRLDCLLRLDNITDVETSFSPIDALFVHLFGHSLAFVTTSILSTMLRSTGQNLDPLIEENLIFPVLFVGFSMMKP